MKDVRIFIIMLLCLVLTGCSSMSDEEEAVERVKVGDHVPAFTVSMTDGSSQWTFNSNQLKGETVIVFFNTTCGDCKRDLPLLEQYYQKHQEEEGFQMIAISREEEDASIAKFWKENNLTIPYSAQKDRRVYNLFATSIIPRIYFCTKEGIVTRIDVEKFNLYL